MMTLEGDPRLFQAVAYLCIDWLGSAPFSTFTFMFRGVEGVEEIPFGLLDQVGKGKRGKCASVGDRFTGCLMFALTGLRAPKDLCSHNSRYQMKLSKCHC